MNSETISAAQLRKRLDEKPVPVLIDVLPEECFLAEHLPNAQNACVYQVDFIDRVRKLAPDSKQPIIVYGSSGNNLASSIAAGKLMESGWSDVADFRGGLSEWRDAAYPTEGTRSFPEPPKLENRSYRVDSTNSVIEWTGRNLAGKHTGTLKLSSGEISVENGRAAAGHFIIDMNSIANTDIADRSLASVLIRHLMSDDFFETAKYPEGRFAVSKIEPISDATAGRPNFVVFGKLTLKNVERDIEFPALIGLQPDGSIAAQANFDIDRTKWNVLYGSGRFFENLGMHLVNDLVSIQLKSIAS